MVKRIVLTGGPGSGKTSVMEKIEQIYSSQGYKVILVEETATYLINKGIRPFGDNKLDLIDFQELVLKFQLAKEDVVNRATEFLDDEKILIVYDRGAIDNRGYINEEQFNEILFRFNNTFTIKDLMDRYDLVINLVGCKDFYTTENNSARYEDPEEAMRLGESTLRSWLGHKNIRIVYPKETLEEKIQEVLNIINEMLDVRQVHSHKKYVIDLKESELSFVKENAIVFDIIQTYLESTSDEEKYLRKLILGGDVTYYYSEYKLLGNGNKDLISEKRIDKKMYESLMEFKSKNKVEIIKKRFYFIIDGEYFNLDTFEGNDKIGILKVNVNSNLDVVIPKEFKVIEEC